MSEIEDICKGRTSGEIDEIIEAKLRHGLDPLGRIIREYESQRRLAMIREVCENS